MSQTKNALPVSIGSICESLREPLHRVRYALESREIQPVGRIGMANVYSAEQVEQVAAALREIDGRQKHAGAGR